MSTTQPCPECGKEIHAQARFCRFCGHSMTTDQEKVGAETSVQLRRAEDGGSQRNMMPLIIGSIVLLLALIAVFVLFL